MNAVMFTPATVKRADAGELTRMAADVLDRSPVHINSLLAVRLRYLAHQLEKTDERESAD
jgi:hypothetical protein